MENGSPAHPFDSIQEGIDAASDGHTVLAAAGTYPGNLTWTAKSLQLIGAGAMDTIVDAEGSGTCLTITDVPNTGLVEVLQSRTTRLLGTTPVTVTTWEAVGFTANTLRR